MRLIGPDNTTVTLELENGSRLFLDHTLTYDVIAAAGAPGVPASVLGIPQCGLRPPSPAGCITAGVMSLRRQRGR